MPGGLRRRPPLPAYAALPAGFAALLAVGAAAAVTHGGLGATAVLVLAGVIVTVVAAAAELPAAALIGVIGWFTATGFSRAPYAQLRLAGPDGLRAAAGDGCVHPARRRHRRTDAQMGAIVQTVVCGRA